MKKTLPTVTIAVSAYNEGKNIIKFLRSLLAQKEEGFMIKSLWIYSDGSTDNTVKLARSLNSPKITVFEFKDRIGKSSRLNQIYQSLDSDFLVQTDADVIFAHPNVVGDIISPLIKDNKIGMCGGYPVPLPGKTFTERADAVTFNIYMKILKFMNGGDNVFSADGRILAYRQELCKKMTVPSDMIANDVFTYYACITKKYKYKFVPSAKVYFRAAQTLKDKIKQNLRSAAVPMRMRKYFPQEIISREMYVPARVRFKLIFAQFLKAPVESVYIYLVNKYCAGKAASAEKYLNAKWDMAYSTKKL